MIRIVCINQHVAHRLILPAINPTFKRSFYNFQPPETKVVKLLPTFTGTIRNDLSWKRGLIFPPQSTIVDWKLLHTMSQRLNSEKGATKAASTPSTTVGDDGKSTPSSSSSTSSPIVADQPLSRQARLKQAVKDYGSTVLVFHICMSLCSLGMFYLLVSSGLDVVDLLSRIGVGGQILQSKVTQGASTFVVAYAVHKMFAPARIGITLTATPLIVKKLRSMGILKKPIQKTN